MNKLQELKKIEAEIKARDQFMIGILTEAISDDIQNFHNLPDELKSDRDIAKAAMNKVGAEEWFATEGLTKKDK